jgi:hypothetical protein
MEIILIVFVVGCIIWIVWKVWTHNQALYKAALDQAWRDVLNDPIYVNRRRYEER